MTKHHAAPLDFSDSGSDKQQMRITHVQLREPSKYHSPHPIQHTLTGSCKRSAGFRCHFWGDLCSPQLQKARCSFYESRNTFHLQLRCCERIHLLSEPNEKHFKLVFLSGHIHFFPKLPFFFFSFFYPPEESTAAEQLFHSSLIRDTP